MIFTILFTFIFLAIIMAIRNILVYKNTKIAIDYIFEQKNYIELEQKYLNKYNKLLFNPFKWTYKQMFKGLEE